jgi:hypothetical protein
MITKDLKEKLGRFNDRKKIDRRDDFKKKKREIDVIDVLISSLILKTNFMESFYYRRIGLECRIY